ncbi:MAG: hypothetical protein II333_07110 [Clostridia bacterium]|nr:hypothetical protein [Clostridia bacterium]
MKPQTILTEEQKKMLREYEVEFSEEAHVNELLDKLDDRITEIGFTEDQEWLNPVGLKLQKLYDDIYWQNRE